MEHISVSYILKRMLKALWIAVAAAVVVGCAYAVVTRAEEESPAAAEADEAFTVDETPAEYYTIPAVHRAAMWQFELNEDTEAALLASDKTQSQYLNNVYAILSGRVQAAYMTHTYYAAMREAFPEIESDKVAWNVFTIENHMLSVWNDHGTGIVIDILAPEYLNEAEYGCDYTDEQLCAYRDKLFEIVVGIFEDGSLTDDLGVTLVRVNLSAEEDYSEQVYLNSGEEAEPEGAPAQETKSRFSLKKLVLAAAAAGICAEGIVFLIALFNSTVKGSEDLKNNAELPVLGTAAGFGPEPAWKEIGVKLAACSAAPENLVLVLAGAGPEDEKNAAEGLKTAMPEYGSVPVLVWKKSDPELLTGLVGKQALIAVYRYRTHYRELRELAEALSQVNASAAGAVLIETPEKTGK